MRAKFLNVLALMLLALIMPSLASAQTTINGLPAASSPSPTTNVACMPSGAPVGGTQKCSLAQVFSGSRQTSAVDLYVDAVNGTDSITCGTGTGTSACKTLPQVARNLCVNYSYSAVPTIHGVAGQTYSLGLAFKSGFSGANSTPLCDGIPTVIFDGHGSTINSTDGGAIILYYVPMTLYVKNVALQITGANGSPLLVRGAGVAILAEGVTLGQAATSWPQAWAYGGGQIATCPVSICPSSGVTLTGGGTHAFLSGENGAIQVEGTTLALSGTPAYTVGFAGAFDGGITSFVSTTITGAATGDQFVASMGGVVNINAQTGGYSICTNTYLPGNKCGQMFGGGLISQMGTPAPTSGCGTGCLVQGAENAFTAIYGTGLGSTNGTTYGPARITFSTRTNYNACAIQPSDPAIGTPWISMVPPAGSANGGIDIFWKGSGASPSGKALYISCAVN